MINAIKSCPLPRELRGHFLTGHPLRGPKPQDYAAAARNLARKPTSPRRAPGRPQACYCLPPGPWPTPWPTPRAIPVDRAVDMFHSARVPSRVPHLQPLAPGPRYRGRPKPHFCALNHLKVQHYHSHTARIFEASLSEMRHQFRAREANGSAKLYM